MYILYSLTQKLTGSYYLYVTLKSTGVEAPSLKAHENKSLTDGPREFVGFSTSPPSGLSRTHFPRFSTPPKLLAVYPNKSLDSPPADRALSDLPDPPLPLAFDLRSRI